jgi:hypothetical protein
LGKQSLHDVSSFSPDQFNMNFSSDATCRKSLRGLPLGVWGRFLPVISLRSEVVAAYEFSHKYIKIHILTHLFNFSIIASALKTALFLPLSKCGYSTGFTDFRPKSILPALSKGL